MAVGVPRNNILDIQNDCCELGGNGLPDHKKGKHLPTNSTVDATKFVNTELLFSDVPILDKEEIKRGTMEEAPHQYIKEFPPNQIVVSATVHRPQSITQ